jgi:pimeloyl-ACP methyl ester carboxylesterase
MQVVVEGLLTNYQILGEGKETLLILPGWKRSVNEWIPVAKSLANKYKVILLDLPGFGITAMPKSTFGVFEYADFVQKFLGKLKIDKCIVLGHSFGGRLAIVLASESGTVKKLVLVDSGGIEQKSLYAKLMQILRKILAPFFLILPVSVKNKIGSVIGSVDYKTSGEMRKIFVKIVNQNLRIYLPKIKIPTVIIWGDKDNQLPVSETKIFKQEIVGSKVRIIWGAGHDPHIQKPEQLANILNEIL